MNKLRTRVSTLRGNKLAVVDPRSDSDGFVSSWPSHGRNASSKCYPVVRPRGRRLWTRSQRGIHRREYSQTCHQSRPCPYDWRDLGRRRGILFGESHSLFPTYSCSFCLQFNADRGETDFAYRLGKIFYQGSIYHATGGVASGSEGVGRVPRDFSQARHYFLKIAREVWPRDPTNPLAHAVHAPKEEGATQVGYAAASAGYLGRMYLRGEGVKKDAAIARMWFERGAEAGDRECHNGLGVIWRDGLVGKQVNEKKALAHFNVAATQELAEAQVNLGKYHYREFWSRFLPQDPHVVFSYHRTR